MSNGKRTYSGRGRSTESFRDAAQKAVRAAERKHATSRDTQDPPQEYELTLLAKAKQGSSLSEYIVVAKGST